MSSGVSLFVMTDLIRPALDEERELDELTLKDKEELRIGR
jgi:hypothetical protein